MKHTKKILAVILSACMICCCSVTAFASEALSTSRTASINDNVENFLLGIDVDATIGTPIQLYNFGNELEALLYPLGESGYVVASYKDGHIVEYSPGNIPATLISAAKNQVIYYGGPLTFCTKSGNEFTNLASGATLIADTDYYSVDYVSAISTQNTYVTQQQTRQTPLLSAPTSYVSATTSNGWYCTITGITNLLQYYDDFYSADVYSGTVSTISGLRSALNTNKYIYNGGLYLSDAATSHKSSYLGLRSYLSRIDVTNYSVTVTDLECSNVKSQIGTYSRPVLLMIYTSSIDDDADASSTHIVLCYGYWETSMTTYYIVNDGWGNNSVYVCADDVPTSFEMLYLRQ